jgi:hypothetical protein
VKKTPNKTNERKETILKKKSIPLVKIETKFVRSDEISQN